MMMYVNNDSGNGNGEDDNGNGNGNGDGNGDGADAATAANSNNVDELNGRDLRKAIGQWQLDNNNGTAAM
jgi:hypothetical protein